MNDGRPEKTGILDLLKYGGGAQYVIPVYQRNYTWTAKKEVLQLLDDISAIIEGERNKHFIGIMIYLEKNVNVFNTERQVIDGQQRLTTIFLILYAIKEIMVKNDRTDEAKQLEDMFLVNIHQKQNKLKLKPLVADDDVYQKIVNGELDKITEKKSNVYINFQFILEYVENLNIDYDLDKILEALNKLYLVCVPVGLDDYPQKIFESINATGAKLTASDLIRNFILMPIESDKQDEYYNKYWKFLEEIIDRDSKVLEAFFRFFIMAKMKSSVNKNRVYFAFTNWFHSNIETLGLEGIFKEIIRYGQYYSNIYIAPIEGLDKDLQKPIEEFRQIPSDMPAPLLMEYYDLYTRKEITAAQFAEIFQILSSYLMRRGLCGLDTSDITRYFPLLLKNTINKCEGHYEEIVPIFKKELINKNRGNSVQMPDDMTLRNKIRNANMYILKSSLMIFFKKYERENNSAPVNFQHLSIEHIMPQTPTKEWFELLGTNNEEYQANVNRLGNLTLASKKDNSKMSNNIWEYKTKILKSTAHLKINLKILEKENWTISDINERTEQLTDEIIKLYPYYAVDEDFNSGIPLSLSFKDGSADALFLNGGHIKVLKGSQLNNHFKNKEAYPLVEEYRKELLEKNIIEEKNNELSFVQDYIFSPKKENSTGLSLAACVILHGSRNGLVTWMTPFGMTIGDYINNVRNPKIHEMLSKNEKNSES